MLVRAARRLPDIVVRGLILAGLFIAVIVLHGAVTSALRAIGVGPGLALAASGLMVLVFVLGVQWRLQRNRQLRLDALQAARERQGLPDGPCCVVWRAPDGAGEGDMGWVLDGPIRVAFPKAAQALRVEGMAVIEFEVGADGKAKNLHCVDVWPARTFYTAAAMALGEAQFTLRPGAAARFGASFRMPFVFRIAGAARLRETGRYAKRRRPLVHAAARAVQRLRQRVSSAS